ncbi:MAG TPA: pyridoxal-phosphate dependent enzyme, partial [Verrucomicrobiae bacterium]|nr:pyridoxal-phosphate dependent enzyme [Verrucomicrobiae bacterium]
PHVRVIGVEAAGAPSMQVSVAQGGVREVPVRVGLADGIAVKRPGDLTFPLVRDLVDDVVLVEEEEIALAIVGLLERAKLMVEGAGAVTVAALLNRRIPGISGKTVCLLSGGNIDVKTISTVVERGLLAAGRYLRLTVELEDSPGSLARLAADVAAANANIFHITHDRRSMKLSIGRTEVRLELETRGEEHIAQVLAFLTSRGYSVTPAY